MKKIITLIFCFLLSGSAAAQEPKTIKFGYLLTLSGSTAAAGDYGLKGVTLAIEQLNKRAEPMGVRFVPIFEDFGEWDLKRAVAAAHKLIQIDKVEVLFPYVSEDVEVVWRLGHKAKMPMIAMRPGGQKVAEYSPYLFRVSASDTVLFDRSAEHAVRRGFKDAAVIVGSSSYCISMKDHLVKVWEGKTGSPPRVFEVGMDRADYRSILTRLRSSPPDVIFTIMLKQGLVIEQARKLGLQTPFMGIYLNFDETIPKIPQSLLEGLVYPAYPPALPWFREEFVKRFELEPGDPADYTYDATKLVGDTLLNNGFNMGTLLRDIAAVSDYPGASGLINFDKHGNRLAKEVALYTYRGGGVVQDY